LLPRSISLHTRTSSSRNLRLERRAAPPNRVQGGKQREKTLIMILDHPFRTMRSPQKSVETAVTILGSFPQVQIDVNAFALAHDSFDSCPSLADAEITSKFMKFKFRKNRFGCNCHAEACSKDRVGRSGPKTTPNPEQIYDFWSD
jgi:hypothetical protein